MYDEETSAAKEGEIKQMQPPPVAPPPKPTTGQAAAAIMAEAGHILEGSEADLVLLPLRLAFETKQSKLVEPALDCLHVHRNLEPPLHFVTTVICFPQ